MLKSQGLGPQRVPELPILHGWRPLAWALGVHPLEWGTCQAVPMLGTSLCDKKAEIFSQDPEISEIMFLQGCVSCWEDVQASFHSHTAHIPRILVVLNIWSLSRMCPAQATACSKSSPRWGDLRRQRGLLPKVHICREDYLPLDTVPFSASSAAFALCIHGIGLEL